MDFNYASERFLLEDLRKGREGVQCERSLRALSFLLDGWEKYEREQSQSSKGKSKRDKGTKGLNAIYFDKFAAFTFRIWTELFRRTSKVIPKANPIVAGKMPNIVTHPSPFVELPGKHGRGPARLAEKDGPIYLVEMLHKLQEEGVLNYFEVTPPEPDKNPKDYRTTVRSAMPVTLSGFNDYERKILIDLSNGLRHLDPSQIRALGTHENCEKTVEDIEKEFKDMATHINETIKGLLEAKPFLFNAREMMEFADEAWRKSKKNRENYKQALAIMIREINDGELKEVLLNAQSQPEQIWDSPEVQELARKAEQVRSFTRYLHAIAYYYELRLTGKPLSPKDRGKFDKEWERIINEMALAGLSGFPATIDDIFVGTTYTIEPGTRDMLIAHLQLLPALGAKGK